MEKDSLNTLWNDLSKGISKQNIAIPDIYPPKQEGFIRFVFASDTHEAIGWESNIPDGDVFIHAGDFTMLGALQETKDFVSKLVKLPHKYKIIIAGNHEMTFDTEKFKLKRQVIEERFRYLKRIDDVKVKEVVTTNSNIIYLENSDVTVYGYKIYGSPVQPYFYDWGFNVRRHKIGEIWEKIPIDTEILVTHGPPLGFGDMNEDNEHVGCADLLKCVREKVKPIIHAFGHIHNDYGMWKDENTIYLNAAVLDIAYNIARNGIVIDLPIKKI